MLRIALLPVLMSGGWCLAGDLAAPPRMGDALDGLNAAQLVRFELGRVQFERNISVLTRCNPLLETPLPSKP